MLREAKVYQDNVGHEEVEEHYVVDLWAKDKVRPFTTFHIDVDLVKILDYNDFAPEDLTVMIAVWSIKHDYEILVDVVDLKQEIHISIERIMQTVGHYALVLRNEAICKVVEHIDLRKVI